MTEEQSDSQTKRNTDEEKNDISVSEKDKNKVPSPAELIANLPEDMSAEVKEFISMSMMQTAPPVGGSRSHPLFEKFTDDHVHEYLDYTQRDDDHEHNLKSSNRWFHLAYTLIGIAFFGFLIVYLLPKDKALLNEILKLLVTFAGGVGSGYGLKSYMESKK